MEDLGTLAFCSGIGLIWRSYAVSMLIREPVYFSSLPGVRSIKGLGSRV